MLRERPRRGPAGGSRQEPISGTEIRVLIVDDYPFVRTGLCTMLERENGIQVSAEVQSPTAANGSFEGTRPNVVVTALMPSRRARTQAIRQIRVRWPDTRVLVLIPAADTEALLATFGPAHQAACPWRSPQLIWPVPCEPRQRAKPRSTPRWRLS